MVTELPNGSVALGEVVEPSGYLQGLRNQTALNLSRDSATLAYTTAIPSLGLSVCKVEEIQPTS